TRPIACLASSLIKASSACKANPSRRHSKTTCVNRSSSNRVCGLLPTSTAVPACCCRSFQAMAGARRWHRPTSMRGSAPRRSPPTSVLLPLPPETVPRRLFWQEKLDHYRPLVPSFECRCSRGRIGRMLLSLGREEVDSIIEEQGRVEVTCDFCNARQEFDAID